MSQSWCCTGCGTWNWESRPTCHYCGRADSERIQWEFVGAGRQERQDKWKGVRCAHQATGQATVQWCPGGEQPRHLFQWREISERETAACTDCSHVQSTGSIGALWRQRAECNPSNPAGRVESQAAWSKTDRKTGRRIPWSHFEVPEAPRGSGNCQSGSRSHYHQRDRGHRALRSGTPDNTTDMCDVSNRGSKHEGSADWPQNTNKVRLTTKTMTEETPQLDDTKGRQRRMSSDS